MSIINTDASKSSSGKLSSVSVLVVDDDYNLAQITRSILSQLGFGQVHLAYNGQQALALLRQKQVDLIISDWEMDSMNGLEFVREVRRIPFGTIRFVPVIMLTGHAERKDVETARDAGVSEFVVKPFSAKALSDKIVLVIDRPRRFVSSSSYNGPDRRRKEVKIDEDKRSHKIIPDRPLPKG